MPYRELTGRSRPDPVPVLGRNGGGYVPEQRRSLASRVLAVASWVIRFELAHVLVKPHRWAMMSVGLALFWSGAALDGSRLGNWLVALGLAWLALVHVDAWLHRQPPTPAPTRLDWLIADQTVPLLEVVQEAEQVAVREAAGAGGQDRPLRLEAPPRQDWPMLGIRLTDPIRQRQDQVVDTILATSGVPGLAWIEDPPSRIGTCAQLGCHIFTYGKAWCECGHQARSSAS